MFSLPQHVRGHPLGYRLLGFILLVSVVLTLISTALQLLLEYRWNVSAIEERMAQVEVSQAESLANSLWSFDETQLETQMKGLLQLPDIQFLELETSYGERYTAGTPFGQAGTLTHSFVLRHVDETVVELGSFKMTASLAGVYQHLEDRILVTLVSQAAQTFLVVLFTLFIFQYLVTRHLGTMAAYARTMSLEHLDRPLVLSRRVRRRLAPDELDEVSQSINEMRLSLRAEMVERRRVEAVNHFLAEASKQLAVSLDYQAVTECICRLAVPELADLAVCFVASHGDTLRLSSLAASAPHQSELAGQLLHHWPMALDVRLGGRSVLASEHLVSISDISRSELRTLAPDVNHRRVLEILGCRSYVAVPLHAHGKRLGVLTLLRLKDAPSYSGRGDQELLEELGRRAATALDNALLYQEAQEAIRMRDEFLTVASHELNTPLTSLRLQAQRLERLSRQPRSETDFREVVRKAVVGMDQQIDRLRQLIGSLLDVSEFQTGRFSLEREELDLAQLVGEVLERLSEPLQRARCPVTLRKVGRVVGRWDPLRLKQVILSLLGNAMKFGAGEPIEVQVLAQQGQALLVVKDHGMGIPAEEQSRIFERLARAVSERHFGGLGLGLFIARQLVEAHGGTIRVESEPGMGATFIVELPLNVPVSPYSEPIEQGHTTH
jgi:signal transduction histidine kinase